MAIDKYFDFNILEQRLITEKCSSNFSATVFLRRPLQNNFLEVNEGKTRLQKTEKQKGEGGVTTSGCIIFQEYS